MLQSKQEQARPQGRGAGKRTPRQHQFVKFLTQNTRKRREKLQGCPKKRREISSKRVADMRTGHHNTRAQFKQVFEALRGLMTPPDPPKRPIGFVVPQEKDKD